MKMLGMYSVVTVGALISSAAMPDVVSSTVVGCIWGVAVGSFWAMNFPDGKKS